MEKVDTTWSGCHWENPAIIKAEVIGGEVMSDEMADFIKVVGAIEEADAIEEIGGNKNVCKG